MQTGQSILACILMWNPKGCLTKGCLTGSPHRLHNSIEHQEESGRSSSDKHMLLKGMSVHELQHHFTEVRFQLGCGGRGDRLVMQM